MAATDSIGFLGGGNMGSAIIAGLQRRQPAPAIRVVDPSPAIRERHAATACAVGEDPALLAGCDVLLLAVKPQVAPEVVPRLAAALQGHELVVSIMAGIPLQRLESWLPAGQRVVRAMPNTPMAIGEGMIGICAGSSAGDAELEAAEAVFASAGSVLRLAEEARMDALTAVSGSGPAFLFRFAEAQLAAALELGFERQEAELLVGRTLQGAVDYLLSVDGFPAAELRQQVTSPGGTTAAGLAVLEEADIDAIMRRVYQAARDRSEELSR